MLTRFTRQYHPLSRQPCALIEIHIESDVRPYLATNFSYVGHLKQCYPCVLPPISKRHPGRDSANASAQSFRFLCLPVFHASLSVSYLDRDNDEKCLCECAYQCISPRPASLGLNRYAVSSGLLLLFQWETASLFSLCIAARDRLNAIAKVVTMVNPTEHGTDEASIVSMARVY